MALPKYDKSKRKKSFQQLPKGAYVVKIMAAREDPNKSGNGTHLSISFDIAEGEYEDFYMNDYNARTDEDRKWNRDAIYYLTVPGDGSQPYVWDNWNTFFADLEDSNNGFVFSGDLKALKGKVIGGKFNIEQSEYNGNVYDHTRLKWICVADDVRNGKAGRMPADKLITPSAPAPATYNEDEWMKIEAVEEELPF